MSFDLRSIVFLLTFYIAFFASGAASLIAEVTWNRMLVTVVGNSVSATAMILAAFMGGLGLGSYFGGEYFSKRRPSLVPYILLEIAIGAYVFLSPALFDLLARLFTSLAESFDDRASLAIARSMVSLAALLLPAFLMGATFPAMISGVAPDSSTRRTARTGYLYSANTLGAAVGCFAAGYYLLGEFGVQSTLTCALGLYTVAVLCALAARKAAPGLSQAAAAPAAGDSSAPAEDPRRRFLQAATFAVGFVALAYQVLLTRLGILYLGNSAPVFPVVLTGFLLGTGISAVTGTWLYGVLRRNTHRSDDLFGFTALAAGAFVLLTPYLLLTDWVLGTDQSAQFGPASFGNLVPVIAIIVAPTVLIGALLPLAIRMLQPEERGVATREAATLYALNTAGGLLGAGLANHYLVPLIGVQGVLIGLASACAAVGVFNLLSPDRVFRRWSATALAVAALAVALAAALPRMMDLYAGKIGEFTEGGLDRSQAHPGGTGRHRYRPRPGGSEERHVPRHVPQRRRGSLDPLLAHPVVQAAGEFSRAGPRGGRTEGGAGDRLRGRYHRGLGTGFGPGLQPRCRRPEPGRGRHQRPVYRCERGRVSPNRDSTFHNDDGRNYLVTSGKRYDVIISDSTHPRAYDSWVLYTEEFYRAVAGRLLPGGIFAQWVPVLGNMQGDLLRIHLNTFRRVFPNSTFWYVYGSDQAFLLATPEPFQARRRIPAGTARPPASDGFGRGSTRSTRLHASPVSSGWTARPWRG